MLGVSALLGNIKLLNTGGVFYGRYSSILGLRSVLDRYLNRNQRHANGLATNVS